MSPNFSIAGLTRLIRKVMHDTMVTPQHYWASLPVRAVAQHQGESDHQHPLGAMTPGATGMRQGPPGGQTAPTWPIIQLAAGIVAMNAASQSNSASVSCYSVGPWT